MEVRVSILNDGWDKGAYLVIGLHGATACGLQFSEKEFSLSDLTAKNLASLRDYGGDGEMNAYQMFGVYQVLVHSSDCGLERAAPSGRVASICDRKRYFSESMPFVVVDYEALVAAAKKVLGEITAETPSDAPGTT